MAPNGLILTKNNVQQLTLTDIISSCGKEYWHKFIVGNGASFDKEDVLKAVLASINPVDLVPVKYTVIGRDTYFLARNCESAVEKLCSNLLAPIKLKDNLTVSLTIHICHTPIQDFKVNMQLHLKQAIKKRFNSSKGGCVDLTMFHKEPELYDTLFCPLSRPRFLLYVLIILKRISTITSINLSNNEIEDVKPLEVLQTFKGLISLNLSKNKINNIEIIKFIGQVVPNLREINIKENPICNNFNNDMSYVHWIKKYIPTIIRIDDVPLNFGLPNQQCCFCNNTVAPLIDKFLKHYFALYDNDRKALKYLYKANSVLSIITSNLSSQNVQDLKLESYQKACRTMIKVNGSNKIIGTIHISNVKITELLCTLPTTIHDPYSFKVDVLYFKEVNIIIVVSGIFKEVETKPLKTRSFRRTFVLEKISFNEYQITNDMYYITDATDDEIQISFRFDNSETLLKCLAEKENKRKLIELIGTLTTMNNRYSKRCLEDCNWDVKIALKTFLYNYKLLRIPGEAFLK